MSTASAVNDVRVVLEESQEPLCQLSGRICKIENALEGVVTSAYRITILFEVQVKESY